MKNVNQLVTSKKKAILFTIIASSLWGTSFPAIKFGLNYIDSYTFVFFRFLLATLTMFVIMILTKNFGIDCNKRLILFLGLINGAAYLLQYIGMFYASASKSSLLINLSVVWVALISPFALKEQLSRKKVVGVFLSFLGILFVITNLDFGSLGLIEVGGAILVIGAGILWAFFIVYNKPMVNENKNLIQSMTWLLLFTLLTLMPLLPFSANNILTLTYEAWIVVIYTSIFCWIIPYYLWMKGLRNISPITSAIILLNEIVVATVISTIVLGEILTVAFGIGALLIIIATVIVSDR